MARQRKLTDKLKEKILSLIADGLTIRELFSRDDIPITWQTFRTYLINDDQLMGSYIKSKELAIDLKLSELEDKRKDLDIIAKGLLDYETLTGDEIINLLKGIDPTREDPSDDDTGGKTLSGSVPKTGGKAQKTEPGLQGT